MFDIRIDTRGLTYTQVQIPELSPALIEGANVPTIQMEPGEYSFLQISSDLSSAAFRFKITPNGLIDYDVANEGFLDGRGTTTLTVRGFTITIDGTLLSDDLLPNVFRAEILSRSSTHDLMLVPAAGYSFVLTANIDFKFDVTVNGQLSVDPRYAGFAEASGRTLKIKGYKITIDGTALSHDLLPLGMQSTIEPLPRNRTNEFTYMPAVGYSFQTRLLADFRFDVTVDGQVAVDPRYAGFAEVNGRTLKIKGYKITIDGTALSHDLQPEGMLGNNEVLPRNRTNELTYMPAAGYSFSNGGSTDFRFNVTVDGQVAVDASYAGFAEARDQTLIIRGYRIMIDGRAFSHDLFLLNILGIPGFMPRDRTHEFKLMPLAAYVLLVPDVPGIDFRFKLSPNGEITMLNVPIISRQ